MESLLGYITAENNDIQQMEAEGGPAGLAAAHERVTKLVWKLKQNDPGNPDVIKAWNMLVDSGEKDLRAMLLYHTIASTRDYSYAFSRLKVKIYMAVDLLSVHQRTEISPAYLSAVPGGAGVSVSLWHRERAK